MSETLVLPEMSGSTRDEALRELVDHLSANSPVRIGADATYDRLLARERLASTAVGKGIAIPHAKLPQIVRAVACLGRSREGVDFGSQDGSPTHIFLTIVAPEGQAGLHLKALARASRLLMDEGFRTAMMEAEASHLWRTVEARDAQLSS
ncbi:MAG: PTS sugar transporter subunit IIA [Myxococcota bacterium]